MARTSTRDKAVALPASGAGRERPLGLRCGEGPERARPPIAATILVVLALSVMGCGGTQYAPRSGELVDLPATYRNAPPDPGHSPGAIEPESEERPPASEAAPWCSDFGSPGLSRLMLLAHESNYDLQAAWARLNQSESLIKVSGAARYPSVEVQGSVARTRTSVRPLGLSAEYTAYGVSLPASYEVDLWGKLGARVEGARLDHAANREDMESMFITIAAQVGEAYFDYVYAHSLGDLVRHQIGVAEQIMELLRLRMEQGLATALDLVQQEQELNNLRGRAVQADNARRRAELQLLAITASHGDPERVIRHLPERSPVSHKLPPLPDSGIPAQILESRPDVRAAILRVEAADRRTAAAARDRLPSLRLSPSLFLQATSPSRLMDEIFYNLAGAVALPVVDGGRRRAEVELAEGVARERLMTYGQTVVRAIQEVEGALVNEEMHARYLEELEEQTRKAQMALQLARARYLAGTVDYLRVLTTLQALQRTEQSLLDAERLRFSLRIGTCRALGDSWKELE